MNGFETIANNMFQLANENIKINDGDYIEGDIWYCGKCNTPKQAKIMFLGNLVKPMAICECEKARIEAEERARVEQARKEWLINLRRNCFADNDMSAWTFDKDDGANEKISQVARNFVQHFDTMRNKGKGLLLYGEVGTGKTVYAAMICNALLEQGVSCGFTNFSRIINTVSSIKDRQEYLDSFNIYDLLVIDDMRAERNTEYAAEIVQAVIDARYRAKLPTIITTNLSGDDLKHPKNEKDVRAFSRLLEMTIPVEVKGADRRRARCKDDYDELKEVLGL